jgi:hypothetical protein
MKEEGPLYSYRNLSLFAIRHHPLIMDRKLLLNWKSISKFIGERTFDNDIRGYTTEEIQKLLKIADVKYKAIILALCNSAMRREQNLNLQKNTRRTNLFYKRRCSRSNRFTSINKQRQSWIIFYFKTPKNLTLTLRQIAIRAGVSQEHYTDALLGKNVPC